MEFILDQFNQVVSLIIKPFKVTTDAADYKDYYSQQVQCPVCGKYPQYYGPQNVDGRQVVGCKKPILFMDSLWVLPPAHFWAQDSDEFIF